MLNNQTVLRTKNFGTELPVEQTSVSLQGAFTLFNITSPQNLRRVQISDTGDFADIRDDGQLVISLEDGTFQEFDLKNEFCSEAVELHIPIGLNDSIALLITCSGGRVLCAKYFNGLYEIHLIFVSVYSASSPVIVSINGTSAAIYTAIISGMAVLAHRSLEPSGYEQIMYDDSFEDIFGVCTETLSYNETHVILSCPGTNDFYLVDGSGGVSGKIDPQGVGDLVNIYNEDMVLVSISSVTINTKEFTNFCTVDLPTPIMKVDYMRTNNELILLFFSSQGLYLYDTAKPCLNENLVILVNETLSGLDGSYQNYVIFGNLLVYTIMENGLYSSYGIDLVTSKNFGMLVNHPNRPLLYGFIHNDDNVTTYRATSITMNLHSIKIAYALLVTTNAVLPTSKTMNLYSITYNNPVTRTTDHSVVMFSAYTNPVTTTTITQTESAKRLSTFPYFTIAFILGIIPCTICLVISICVCVVCRVSKKSMNRKLKLEAAPLEISSSSCAVVPLQISSSLSSTCNSSIPHLQTASLESSCSILVQAELPLSSSLSVCPSHDLYTDKTSTLQSYLSMDPIHFTREEQEDRNKECFLTTSVVPRHIQCSMYNTTILSLEIIIVVLIVITTVKRDSNLLHQLKPYSMCYFALCMFERSIFL